MILTSSNARRLAVVLLGLLLWSCDGTPLRPLLVPPQDGNLSVACGVGLPACPREQICAAPLGRFDQAVCVADPCQHFCGTRHCGILESFPAQIACPDA